MRTIGCAKDKEPIVDHDLIRELAELLTETGLTEIETYRADGFSGTVNRYSLLMRP